MAVAGHQDKRLIDMRRLRTAGIGVVAATLFAAGSAAPASAQQMSEKSVRTLMEYAWALTPDRFTKPNGETIDIDRKKRAEIEVPLNVAGEVIRVGRLSAHAQMCDLPVEHTNNYRSLMYRESLKKKWTEQQMVFMNQLHLVTVMLLTGKLRLIEREEGKEPKVIEESVGKEAKSCTPEQAEKVKQAIVAYVNSGPPMQTRSAAGGPVPAPANGAQATTATPAAAKK
jgi:hypothetical protein